MTPFGIRKRLKGMIGGTSESEPDPTFTVTYILPDGSKQQVTAEERYSLLMASQSLPAPISTGKRAGGTCPDGYCTLCRVEIVDDTGLTPMGEYELKALQDAAKGTEHEGRPRDPLPEPGPNTRLACHCKIVGDGGVVQVAELFDYESVKGSDE